MRRPLFLLCLCFVAAMALLLSPGDAPQEIEGLPADGDRVTITGKVYEKNRAGKDTLSMKIKSLKQSFYVSATESWQNIPIEDNLICEVSSSEKLPMGSFVMLRGTFQKYEEANNPGEFDSAQYYRSLGIGGKLTDVTVLKVGEGYSLLGETLYRIKCYFRNRLYRVFPEKEASVMTAMLLGDKQELDKGTKTLYMESGIIHILSISGLHITMIGMGIYKLLRRIGVPIGISACVGTIILSIYGILTGMSVSACRAIGMYLIRMLALVTGRTYDMLTALGVLAVVLVVQNPVQLYNAAFLLSFGSILGVGMLYPIILPGMKGKLSKLLQPFLASSAIILFTLPIQLWIYYEVPVYSVFINWLVLPFVSVLMFTGLTVMLLPGTGLVGSLTCVILQGYEWICELFGRLPHPTWNPGRPEKWQVVLYYGILILLIAFHARKQLAKKPKRKAVIVFALVLIAVGILHIRIPGNKVTFLDVGQGDGILVETEGGQVFLFDCGSSSRKKVGEYVLIPYLKYRGIRHIDAIFLSHADGDHSSGIKELLERGAQEGIAVGRLILPDIRQELRQQEFGELISLGQENGMEIFYMTEGERMDNRDFSLLCLHPPKGYDGADSNGSSLCFYLKWKQNGMSLLLTGDVEEESEEMLLQKLEKYNIGQVTALKVAHHGSRYSTSEAFLEQIKPQVAVISCGRNNSYGHPHEETLLKLKERNIPIFTTQEYGAIILKIGREMELSGFRRVDRVPTG